MNMGKKSKAKKEPKKAKLKPIKEKPPNKAKLLEQVDYWRAAASGRAVAVQNLQREAKDLKDAHEVTMALVTRLRENVTTLQDAEEQARRTAREYAQAHEELSQAMKRARTAHWRPPEGLPPDRYLVKRSNCYVNVGQQSDGKPVPAFQLFAWEKVRKPTVWGWWEVTEHGTAVLIAETDELGNLKNPNAKLAKP
jgi:uncharacterized protein YukE